MEAILKTIKRKKIPINPCNCNFKQSKCKRFENCSKAWELKLEVIESKGFKGSRGQNMTKKLFLYCQKWSNSKKWTGMSCRIYENNQSRVCKKIQK